MSASQQGLSRFQVIPTPLHVLGRISPIFPPFFPVFCAFSPSRRGGSNEPKTGIQGQETVSRAPKHRFAGPANSGCSERMGARGEARQSSSLRTPWTTRRTRLSSRAPTAIHPWTTMARQSGRWTPEGAACTGRFPGGSGTGTSVEATRLWAAITRRKVASISSRASAEHLLPCALRPDLCA